MKFQIQQELGAKPESSYVVKGRVGLTEWLVHTLLLVRAEEYHRAAYPATPTSQRSDQIEVIGQVRCAMCKRGTLSGILGQAGIDLRSFTGSYAISLVTAP